MDMDMDMDMDMAGMTPRPLIAIGARAKAAERPVGRSKAVQIAAAKAGMELVVQRRTAR
jgi:hypothetical protein